MCSEAAQLERLARSRGHGRRTRCGAAAPTRCRRSRWRGRPTGSSIRTARLAETEEQVRQAWLELGLPLPAEGRETMRKLWNSHPNLVSWAVLAIGMVIIVVFSARNVGFQPAQWAAIIVATILLAGLVSGSSVGKTVRQIGAVRRRASLVRSKTLRPRDVGAQRGCMSKRDYYEVLGVPRERGRDRDQGRIPPPGAAVSPGRQQGRRRRRTLQGDQRGLRGAERRRPPRGLRPLRPCGHPGLPGRRRAAVSAARVPGPERHFRRVLRGFRRHARRRGARAARRAARTCATISRSPSRKPFSARRRKSRSRGRKPCPVCNGSRRRAGNQAHPLPAVQRHGRGAPRAADDPGPVRQRDDVPALQRRAGDRHLARARTAGAPSGCG